MNTTSEIIISEEWWDLYMKKYKDLMYMISYRISGDSALCSVEDNFSDLCISAIESVRGFIKKTGCTLEELFDNPLFDKYTKTCLWKNKAKKGARITERMKIRNCSPITMETEDGNFDISALAIPGCSFNSVDVMDLFHGLKIEENKQLIDVILKHPDVIRNCGNFNYAELSRILGCCIVTAQKRVGKLTIELETLGVTW